MLCVTDAHAMEMLLPHTTEEPTPWNYYGARWQYRKFSTMVLSPKSIWARACLTEVLKSWKGKEGSGWEVVIKRSAKTNGLSQLLTSLLCSPRWQTALQVNGHPLHLSRSLHRGLGRQPTTEDCLQLLLPSYWVRRNNHWAVIAVLLQKLKQNGKMMGNKRFPSKRAREGTGREGRGRRRTT